MRRIFLVVGLCLVAGGAALAQQPEPLTYMAEYRVKPGQQSAYLDWVKKHHQPLFDRLLSEGTVQGWGVEATEIHRDGGTTHMFWYVTADYAGLGKVRDRLRALTLTDGERGAFWEAVDPAGHHDHLNRSIIFKLGEQAPTASSYTSYSVVKVQPGKGNEWRELFEKYNKPVLDQLVADGTLMEYGVDVETYHTEDPAYRLVWLVLPDLAAHDMLNAAFEADRAARGERERATINLQFENVTVPDAHRDYLYRTVLMGGASSQ